MGPSPCLRETSGVEANSSAVRCHSRTLQKEGQPTSRVSGFYQLLEKKSCTSRGCQLTSVLDYSAVRENRAGKAGACSELFMGQEGWWAQRERGPQPSVTCQIEGQRQLDVKLGTMVPPSAPSLLDLFTYQWSFKAEGSVAEVGWELNLQFLHHSQPCGFSGSTTDVTSSSLCSKKCAQHVNIIQFLFLALLLWEFWISFVFNH